MIGRYLIAVATILIVAAGWLLVQALARRFAARNPEFGPAREEGGGCGGCGHCAGQADCNRPRRTP